jgi:hypothetical protein
MKASKNRNNVFDEERLTHIRTIVVSLGGKLTYVLIYATTKFASMTVCCDFCSVYLILLFVTFVELLVLVDTFFCCLWVFFVVCV